MKTKPTHKYAVWALMFALTTTTLTTTTGCRALWNAFAIWTWFADLTPEQIEEHYQQGMVMKETQPDKAYQHLHIAALRGHSAAMAERQRMEKIFSPQHFQAQRQLAETNPLFLN